MDFPLMAAEKIFHTLGSVTSPIEATILGDIQLTLSNTFELPFGGNLEDPSSVVSSQLKNLNLMQPKVNIILQSLKVRLEDMKQQVLPY